jgi:ABC-type transport system involved in multi-copper enzyme maturation permease subunit
MRTPWQSLLWKELREHRAVFACLLVIFALVPLSTLGDRRGDFGDAALVALIPFTALFLAANLGAGERSRGTDRFLQALPIETTHPAAAKLLVGIFTAVVPAVVATLVLYAAYLLKARDVTIPPEWKLFEGAWGITHPVAATIVGATLIAVSFLLWGAAASVNRANEIRAGAVTICVVAGTWIVASFALELCVRRFGVSSFRNWGELIVPAIVPGGAGAVGTWGLQSQGSGPASLATWVSHFGTPLLLTLVVHIAVGWRYLRRFARYDPSSAEAVTGAGAGAGAAPVTATSLGWLDAPRKSTRQAILWKQLRESLPLTLAGWAATLAVALVVLISRWFDGGSFTYRTELILGKAMLGTVGYLGVFVALIGGVAVLMEDMRPGMSTFWRSRPIRVDQWFWTKYLTGLVVTVGGLALAAVPGLLLIWGEIALQPHLLAAMGMTALVMVNLFGAASATMALVRRPLIAAVLALGAFVLVVMALGYFNTRFEFYPLAVATIVVALATLGTPVLAWQAVKRDWGWVEDQ